jgi:hypothetical protein
MDETTGTERSEVMIVESPEEHHARGRWGIAAAIAAAVVGTVFAARRVRTARHSQTPMTIA